MESFSSQSPVLLPPQSARTSVCFYVIPSYVQMFFQLMVKQAEYIGPLCLSEDWRKSTISESLINMSTVIACLGRSKEQVSFYRAEKAARIDSVNEVTSRRRGANRKIWWQTMSRACLSEGWRARVEPQSVCPWERKKDCSRESLRKRKGDR